MEFGSVLLAAFGIGLLIFLHELGHYLAARLAGVRVEVFSLGFGPRLFGFPVGHTDFRLSLVPFGGYVMVAGQDPQDQRYPRRESLYSKSVGARALFWSGGVLMNLLFALVVFPLVFRNGVSFVAPEVGSVETGSAAWVAELQPGDRILAINGKATYSFENLAVEIALLGHAPVQLDVQRGSERRLVTVAPRFDPAAGLYTLGIGQARVDAPPAIDVVPGSAAADAGLRTGDELLAIDGEPTVGQGSDRALQKTAPQTPQPVVVRIRNASGERDVQLTPRPLSEPQPPRIGVTPLRRIVGGVRPHPELPADVPLRPGDVLLAVDGLPFVGGDFAVVAAGDGPLVLHVLRAGKEQVLRLPLTQRQRSLLADRVALLPDSDGLLLAPTSDGAAAAAGLRAGDRIVAIDGHDIGSWDELRRRVEAAGDGALRCTVQRAAARPPDPGGTFLDPATGRLRLEQQLDLQIQPQRTPLYDLGIGLRLATKLQEVRAESFGDAVHQGLVCSLDLVKQLYVTLKRLVTGDVAAKNLGGIITISRVSYQFAQWGPSRFFWFLALLSLNLAFLNILPIPVLDGGHLLFLLIERIKGSPVSTRVLSYSQVLGLVFVLLLVLYVTYNDILRLL